jgi:anion-transporting  ArsA/GET3 family ATPase
MSLILTFLGKGGTGKTTMAIAAAKQLADRGNRVLLVGQDGTIAFRYLLGVDPSLDPQEIASNLFIVELNSTILLERGWEEIKELEGKYLRSPTIKNVYGQELGILPGMDQALALNRLREYDQSNKYDVIIYDGTGDVNTLRMIGIPDILSWYLRRFGQVFKESDIGKALSPFVQPITSAILNVAWSPDHLNPESTNKATQILDQGLEAIKDPNRVAAYLVTTDDPMAIATAKSIWGGANQVGLTVGGVLLNQGTITDQLRSDFTPLPLNTIPSRVGDDWQNILDALPNFRRMAEVPKPLTIDSVNRQVKVFLPGFDKKQVKLTQYGTEITIEAGDQRRNIMLPSSLVGQSVKVAKFQDKYLIISL